MRIALDTNVLVSAFATRGLSSDIVRLVIRDHQLVLGETVLAELGRILSTKFQAPSETVEETLAFLRSQSVIVTTAPELSFRLRDRDDEPVLAEAIEGLAEVLVSGDQDLIAARDQAPISIMPPRELWESLRGNAPGA